MTTLGSLLDDWVPDEPQRIKLATVTATNTVQLAGESIAIALPALATVVAGQTAAVLVASGSRLILGPVDGGQIRDDAGRQYLRTDTSRGGTQLVQYGQTSINTDANGDMTVTFPESFDDIPTCTATIEIGSSVQRTAQMQGSPSTSAVTFRLMSNGSAMANETAGALHWFAAGFKDMT